METVPCEHTTFQTEARVARLTQEEDGPVIGYSVDVRIYCSNCKAPLLFRGEVGMAMTGPRVSFTGQEARLPADIGTPGSYESFAEEDARRLGLLAGGQPIQA